MIKKTRAFVIFLLFLSAVTLCWQKVIELRAEEPRRAIVTSEMVISGEYIVPHICAWPYYNKPPLFNWVQASFVHLSGSMDEWIMRLPGVLSYLITGLLVFFFTRKHLGVHSAIAAALVYYTGLDLLMYGTVNSGEIDLFYSLVVSLQIFVLFHFRSTKNWTGFYLVSYFLVAVGFLTKGLPSLPFQAFTILAISIWDKNWKMLFQWQHFAGIAMLFILVGSYLFAFEQSDDVMAFLARQLKEASQRTGLEHSVWETTLQAISFPFKVLGLLAPWSLIALLWYKKNIRLVVFSSKLVQFSAVFVVANIWLYWFSGDFKQRYLYMFLPFLSIIIGQTIIVFQSRLKRASSWDKALGIWIISLACLVWGLLLVPQTAELPSAVLKVVALSLLFVGILILRTKVPAVIVFALTLVSIRLISNLFFLPASQNASGLYYRETVKEMVELTDGNSIHMVGRPYQFTTEMAIGPINFGDVTMTTASQFAFQIPYYTTLYTGKRMEFTTEVKPEQYYIARKVFHKSIGAPGEVIYTYRDRWTSHKFVLFIQRWH